MGQKTFDSQQHVKQEIYYDWPDGGVCHLLLAEWVSKSVSGLHTYTANSPQSHTVTLIASVELKGSICCYVITQDNSAIVGLFQVKWIK